ncbi:MAG: leucyl aminopeptidase [Bryobacteraceae bacterium]|jgi:leucyl aminopeptidase
MEVDLNTARFEEVETGALAVLSFEGAPDAAVNAATAGWLKELYDSGEFSGKAGETALLHRPAGLRAKRLLVVGAGKAGEFTPAEMRKAAAIAARMLQSKKVPRIAFAPDEGHATAEFASAAVEGAILGVFEPDRYKTESKKDEKPVEAFSLVGGAELRATVEQARIVAEAQNFTRELANEPANRLTPADLADRARETAAAYGLECEVLDQDRMRQLGMGALLGVAQGSAQPPALIVLRYTPERSSTADHLALVGKGVTFDTGGISIKPADGMEKMKYDMSGGAAVLGAMRAIAQRKPAVRVTALIPAVENMPGAKAQRPGDIVTTLAGKTVEVLNTDAEGRLILIDAITYAIQLGCTHLVDAATLTGSVVVALGHHRVGAFSNNDEFLAKVLASAGRQGEKMWRMPMDAEYKEQLKSPFADLSNIGTRWGGSITAAWFLREFAADKPWVHLDIAGTAYLDDAKPWMAKGPTGVTVRTFVDLATNWV